MRSSRCLLCTPLMILMLFAQAAAADRLPVFVSIQPQKFFVQQIGGDHVDVQVMVQPGASPHTYEPKPRQMTALAGARLYFAIGVPFEAVWVEKIAAANPALKVVHTDSGIEKRAMAVHGHDEDAADHHEEGDHHGGTHPEEGHSDNGTEPHDQGGLDPHIWLSPPLVKIQIRAVRDAFQAADLKHQELYEANYRAFAAQIDQLDADLKMIFAGKGGLAFMVFHPSWGYFAEAYGLVQVPIEFEGKDPKPAQLQALIENARERGITVIFAQPQFSRRSAGIVADAIGGQVVTADPMALNWLENMREVAGKFEAALR